MHAMCLICDAIWGLLTIGMRQQASAQVMRPSAARAHQMRHRRRAAAAHEPRRVQLARVASCPGVARALGRRGVAVMRSGPCDAQPGHMQAPLEITFRGMASSPSVEAAAVTWVARLEHLCDRIQHCRVWIDLPHRHHRHGASFQVKIDLTIPGAEIAVTQDGDDDVYVVLAEAFLAVRRQLHDRVRILRGDIKHHAA
jgi:ribosome-associated translation inhibitor RaiA